MVPRLSADGVYMTEKQPCATPTAAPDHPADSVCGIAPLRELLDQVRCLLETLTDAQYVQSPVGSFKSSVGGHIRHSLDHIGALLTGFDSGEIDYEARERGTTIETDRAAALDLIRSLDARLAQRIEESSTRPVRTLLMLRSDCSPVELNSTCGRETAFVLSHTIHHNAMVAAMLSIMNVEMPNRFGYAPGTIAHLQRQSCAR